MKKIVFLLTVLSTLAYMSCSNSKFEEYYIDPSKTSDASIPKLMTGVFQKGNTYTMPWYDRYFTFETQQIGRFAQTLGWVNTPSMYLGMGTSYNENRWTNFYKVLANFRTLEDNYNQLDAETQKDLEVFLLCAKIFVYDHLQQIVDLWGDVPFTKAGTLWLNSDIVVSRAPYDSASDLYILMLDDLKKINESLSIPLSPFSLNTLQAQDYINHGKVDLWRKYCNSLRLRIAARAADQGPIVSQAKAAIVEILGDPVNYPVVNDNSENILIGNQPPDLEAINNMSPKGIQDGFESWDGQCNRASKAMIDALNGDPRLPILFDTNSEGQYVGIDPLMSSTTQSDLFNRPLNQGGNYFSAVDSATFSRNNMFPGIIVTAAEIDFIKAEAIQRWGVSGNVQEAFISGVTKSIEFYFYLNNIGSYRTPLPAPSAAEITTFATNKWNSSTNQSELIATQKWLHFGNIQMVQAWNEVRKTEFPALSFTRDEGNLICPLPPARLIYPVNERNYNTDNYIAVKDKDTYTTKLFWAK